MKIIQVIQKPQLRGAEIFACQLSSELKKIGVNVIIVSLFQGDAQLPFEGAIIKLNRTLEKRFYDIQGWKQLAKIIKEEKPDIVQANAADTLKFSIFSKLIFNWKTPIIFRNASVMSLYIKGQLKKSLNHWLLKKVTHIVSVSELSKKDINKLYPFTYKMTSVIPVGIDKNRQMFKSKDSNKKIIIHVGGFTFEKNHEAVIEIFKGVKNKSNVELWLLGDGQRKHLIEKMVYEAGLNNLVHFKGYVQNPMEYIANADVLILPSIIEGLPGVILEAQLCKVPVVAFDVGGVSEIVKGYETGFLVEKNNIKQFKEILNRIFNGDIRTDKIIENAYKQVVDRFNNEVISQRFLDLYIKIKSANGN